MGMDVIVWSLFAILLAQIYLAYRIEVGKVKKKGNYGPPFIVVLLAMVIVAYAIRMALGAAG
jgi:hypothetical protein